MLGAIGWSLLLKLFEIGKSSDGFGLISGQIIIIGSNGLNNK